VVAIAASSHEKASALTQQQASEALSWLENTPPAGTSDQAMVTFQLLFHEI
jgi:hypothetical protein